MTQERLTISFTNLDGVIGSAIRYARYVTGHTNLKESHFRDTMRESIGYYWNDSNYGFDHEFATNDGTVTKYYIEILDKLSQQLQQYIRDRKSRQIEIPTATEAIVQIKFWEEQLFLIECLNYIKYHKVNTFELKRKEEERIN